jgi:hypothetical protein
VAILLKKKHTQAIDMPKASNIRTHQFINIIITTKCPYRLGDIAYQMQHIDFAPNPPTIYFGEPYNPLIFYFGSTYIPLWTTQGSHITHPNFIEMTQILSISTMSK